jgi:hypothetical protein
MQRPLVIVLLLSLPPTVAAADAPPVSFKHDVIAALTKQGCNAGSCHGSPSGKGGFSLSMLGYDPDSDLTALVRSGWSRRVNLIEPEASLLLRKPTMQIAHGGGQKLRKTDVAYAVLRRWIAAGAKADRKDLPALTKIDVAPALGGILRKDKQVQQVRVVASYGDGSKRDVTALALFTTSHESIARVSADGLVQPMGRGITAINVRYLDAVVSLPFTVVDDVAGFVWNNPPCNNYIDNLVYEQLKLLQFLPSPTCADEVFLRRVYLDVTGLLPTVDETKAFRGDGDPHKRARLIDRLLDSPEYGKFWAQREADLLGVNPQRLSDKGAKLYHAWIAESVAKNIPYDRFVRAMLTATGDTYANPPTNYYRAAGDTISAAETTSQLFLGVRIACAKCHNHPYERWTQDNYYGIAAIFNGGQRKQDKADKRARGDGPFTIAMIQSAQMRQPRTGQTMKPWLPLFGEAVIAKDQDPRIVFADWLTRPDNPFFARVAVNRLWAHLMGRGIVDPVDDFRASNPPANAGLLDALADDFVKHAYDRKHMLRTILNSRAYQRSTDAKAFNQEDERHFSRARIRLLTAEQLLDAVARVTGVPDHFPGVPAGTMATQLPVPLKLDFLSTFGQPARETSCQCERISEPSLAQALQMLNGASVVQKVSAGNNRLRKLVAAKKKPAEIVSELYLAAFCREPRPLEMARALAYIGSRPNQDAAYEDLLWVILNTKEFLFQH